MEVWKDRSGNTITDAIDQEVRERRRNSLRQDCQFKIPKIIMESCSLKTFEAIYRILYMEVSIVTAFLPFTESELEASSVQAQASKLTKILPKIKESS